MLKFESEVHVPNTSPLVALYPGNWRNRAFLDVALIRAKRLQFSVVQSLIADRDRK